jgi:hypothetical protein
VYWLAVVMVAIVGTMVAHALHIQLGAPFAVSTVGFAVVLTLVNDDSVVAAAMLDRLLHRATVISIVGESYRMRAYQAHLDQIRQAISPRTP